MVGTTLKRVILSEDSALLLDEHGQPLMTAHLGDREAISDIANCLRWAKDSEAAMEVLMAREHFMRREPPWEGKS